MTTRCPRSWEVEAARDGRLSGEARESYASHILACRSCATNASALVVLARCLRDLEVPAVDDVLVRRLRNSVLDSVDAERALGRAPARSRRALPVVLMVAAAVLLVGGITTRWRSRGDAASVPSVPSVARVETAVDVIAADGARYTRSVRDGFERFELEEGSLRLRVRRATDGRRVVVKMPDGEIEDIGTVFEVTVANGQTEHVGVEEGRVLLRLVNVAPITLDAGGTWQHPTLPATAPIGTSPRPKAKVTAAPSARPVTKATSDATASAEDRAYLEVLRLLGERRDGEARAAAEVYMREFPAGFRREEMRRVAEER